MAGYQTVQQIEVRVWGQLVGAVALDPAIGYHVFEYARSWRQKGVELSPFHMPTSSTPPLFVFPQLEKATFMGLPGMLADALPDSFGNALIDSWMSKRGIAAEHVTTLDRLAYMGKRSMGALEFKPARSGAGQASLAPLQMASLVEAARKAIEGDLSTDDLSAESLNRIISVGTSAGGARAKAVVGWNPETNALVSGQFDLPDGYQHWLLKFDGMGKDKALGPSEKYGRIEFAYSQMAKAAGIHMAECRLLEENDRAHFMTKRFDRNGNQKIHVQSLCALAHMDYKLLQAHAYESLFLAAHRLGLDGEAMTQLFRRMAFNVIARNQDDHTKNFAFMLEEGGRWALAPAYDLIFAYKPDSIWNKQHLMSINGKFDGMTREDLHAVVDRFSIPNAKAALEEVRKAVADWPRYAEQAGLDEEETSRIAGLHRKL